MRKRTIWDSPRPDDKLTRRINLAKTAFHMFLCVAERLVIAKAPVAVNYQSFYVPVWLGLRREVVEPLFSLSFVVVAVHGDVPAHAFNLPTHTSADG